MKLLCIQKYEWVKILGGTPSPGPKYGEEVTGTLHRLGRWDVYILVEYPDPSGYIADYFIPISDIDEVQLLKEREGVLTN